MAILERLRGDARSVDIGQIAKDLRDDLREDLPAIRDEAIEAVERVLAGASKAIESAADDIGEEAAASPVGGMAAAAGDAVARGGSAASRTTDAIGQSIARAGRELNLDGRIDDVVKRIRHDVSTERLSSLVAGLERELPSTDRDRYDRAYARGWTRARTSFVGVGLVAGIAAGIAGAFLLDPSRGAARRAAIGGRARSVGAGATSVVRGKVAVVSERVRSVAAERGLLNGDADAVTGDAAIGDPAQERADTALVGVMDAAAIEDVITDPASTASDQMTSEGGIPDEPAEVHTA